MWLRESTREKKPYRIRWEALVIITQLNLREGSIPVELTWTTMILLPKWRRYYRGIGMVEVT